ncbi:ribonuclease P protein component [Proteinivorax tanatarense]|uniref:Ribonuclease P protein component n=1 Tax=Proteinivorax tanatarense TaxID=1260629 RepID=A0AAU7VLW1_9FIRM
MANFLPLKKDGEFRKIYKLGKSKATKNIVVYYLKTDKTSFPKVGFVASKKVGKAVTRNKYRRIMKEAFKSIPDFTGYNLIILARPKIVESDYNAIHKDINFLLKRHKIL